MPSAPLHVRADLRLVVDGLEATLRGDGTHFIVTTTDAPRLLAQAAQANPGSSAAALRSLAAGFARVLDDAGLTVTVNGSRGTVVHLGAECDSRLARLLLGTRGLEIRSYRDVTAALVTYLRHSPSARSRAVRAGSGLAIAGLVVAAVARRQHA